LRQLSASGGSCDPAAKAFIDSFVLPV